MPCEPPSSLTSSDGTPASCLGLAAWDGQDPACAKRAFESGINYFFFYGVGQKQFIEGLKPLVRGRREQVVIASGSGSRTRPGLISARQRIFKAAGLAMLDVFFAEYIHPDDDREQIFGAGGVLDVLGEWKSAGLIRSVGATAHNRELARELALDPRVDVLMHRFNMAHRKAAEEVFPAALQSRTPVVAFTATRWGTLLEASGERGVPPTAADCYRYCLSQPAVRTVLTAPRSVAELNQNLTVLTQGPMRPHELRHWEAYGDRLSSDKQSAFETRWP